MGWKVDVPHSNVEFTARHMMITKVRGSFRDFDGDVTIDENDFTASTLEGTVQVASIDTGNEDRDAHLRSADFFDVDTYPTMRFVATNIMREDEDEYEVEGELTIKDVTQAVRWEVEALGHRTDPYGNEKWGFSAETKIDRRDFGLTWNVPLDGGGVLVGNTIEIELSVQFQKVNESEAAA
ncbi:MAG: YceI family protein [Anaerolineales bacterium]|nr:YceI family protein [Anaerolineales bacterium]MCB9126330.1 YceI family protein [Ardenticatenales bacterium]